MCTVSKLISYKELHQWFPGLSPKSNPDQQDQYFTMRIAHSVPRETFNENYPFDLPWSNDFTSRIMTQQLQYPWVVKCMWGLYSCENMCPLDLREALCPLYNEFYKKIRGEDKNPTMIPFSLSFSAVFTGKQQLPYVAGRYNTPPPQKPFIFTRLNQCLNL